MRRAVTPKQIRRWAPVAALAIGSVVVVVLVVIAFTSSPESSSDGETYDPLGSADTSAPPFSIPPVKGCSAANSAQIAAVTDTLQPGTAIRNARTTRDGDFTYIAAVITSGGVDARDEPGLWAQRGNVLLAVGSTSSISSATPADSVGLYGTSSAASSAIGCAAGY